MSSTSTARRYQDVGYPRKHRLHRCRLAWGNLELRAESQMAAVRLLADRDDKWIERHELDLHGIGRFHLI